MLEINKKQLHVKKQLYVRFPVLLPAKAAATFRRCTLDWFAGYSFKALIHGFESRHRRHDLDLFSLQASG
jgi:hypothetical protein